jgi:hypothetical protein
MVTLILEAYMVLQCSSLAYHVSRILVENRCADLFWKDLAPLHGLQPRD